MVSKLNKQLSKSKSFSECKPLNQFAIKHFAGLLVYTADGFLNKNKDPLSPEVQLFWSTLAQYPLQPWLAYQVIKLLRLSGVVILKDAFAALALRQGQVNSRRATGNGRRPSLFGAREYV